MSTQGNVSWDQLCEIWNDCTSQRVWNCFTEIMSQNGGVLSDMDLIKRNNLTSQDKSAIVSLYVEVFKDHLTSEEKRILETAGIRLTYFNKADVNDSIQVILKNKNIVTENINQPKHEDIKAIKTISLKELMKILNVK